MVSQEQIEKYYSDNKSIFSDVKEEAVFIIQKTVKSAQIKVHSIQSRVKELSSLISKAENLEISSIENLLEKVNDIVGIRVICLFLSDIAEIKETIEANFRVIHEDNKLDGSDITSFGYFSVHFICSLKDEHKGPRYDHIRDVKFEIQVRTISMDAWANISHYLDYKTDVEIPLELKKDFFALSGLFYVADTHFEMFFKEKKTQKKLAKQNIETKVDVTINYETLNAYLNNNFPDRKNATPSAVSQLTQELIFSGYDTIKKLDDKMKSIITRRQSSYFSKHLNKVGVVRYALLNNDSTFRKAMTTSSNQKKSK